MSSFLKSVVAYIRVRWALFSFLAAILFLRWHAHGKDLPMDAITYSTGALLIVIIAAGWSQLVRAPGSGIYFGFLLVSLLLAFFPVLFVAFPFLLLIVVIDLF